MRENILIAFAMTAVAGLSTGIGGALAFITKKTNTKFLSVSLGFSAGVMIYVSMAEILREAEKSLSNQLGDKTGLLVSIIAFFGGMLFIAVIDKVIPGEKNPHEVKTMRNCGEMKTAGIKAESKGTVSLMRTGIFTALAIAVHNFPEGLATFVSALQEPSVAVPIVVAIAIHNIPEGIAVSIPIYYATSSKKKAFLYSLLSGLAEPLGAVVGYLILLPFMNELIFGVLFAMVAGIMVFISFDELLPAAREYGEHHLSIYGLVAGMALMAVSLWLFV